jgi:poly-gamma-glutamate capsule biosynthesis protein CapA/YwtB (metallophosphatase superfamily)
VRSRDFAYAGTGEDLPKATAPGYRESRGGRVALVSMASGAIREGAAATATRAGVNEVKLEKTGELNAEDVSRNLAAIREAAKNAAYVFAYQHNHYWDKDFRLTPVWQRAWAKQCIDAGATAFISHGAPLLHGIEVYRGCPIFYDLGSLVFHSKTPVGYYIPEVWDSAVADCIFENGRLASLELIPVALNEKGIGDGDKFLETRGRPTIARGADAERILARLDRISSPMGLRIAQAGDVGRAIL